MDCFSGRFPPRFFTVKLVCFIRFLDHHILSYLFFCCMILTWYWCLFVLTSFIHNKSNNYLGLKLVDSINRDLNFPTLESDENDLFGFSIIPIRFLNFVGMLPTRWLFERSRIQRQLRLEIPSRMEPWRVVFRKFRTWRVDIWLINSGNSPLILLSWTSRCSRWLILVRFLGKLPVNLIFPKEKISISW